MKTRVILTSSVALALAVPTGLGFHASAGSRDVKLRAVLSGLNEVPPVASPAAGTLRASLDEAAQTITFKLNYRNMAGNPTAAHVHFGQSRVNGGVMFFLCGGGGKPACPAATSGTITGTITAKDVVGPAAQGMSPGDFAKVVHAIKTGNSYVNIHNDKFPNGELRGQIAGPGFGHADDCDDADDSN